MPEKKSPTKKVIGEDFLISTTNTGTQQTPAVRELSGGRSIVIWSTELPGDNYGIYAQILDINGSKVGGEIHVNTRAIHQYPVPAIAKLTTDYFVVTWTCIDSNYHICGQLFDTAGNKVGSEFFVDNNTSYKGYSAIAELTNGFVVTWMQVGDSHFDIFAQIFNGSGIKIGGEFLVNQNTNNYQGLPAVTEIVNNRFVVVWEDENDGSGYGVYAQIFDANGNKIVNPIRVNSDIIGNQSSPAVARIANTTNFVVVWRSQPQSSGSNIYGQIFNALGNRLGDKFLVSENTTGHTYVPAVTRTSEGFAVTWQNSSTRSIICRVYKGNGSPIGNEFRLNDNTVFSPTRPDITELTTGNKILATWQASKPTAGYDIYGKIIQTNLLASNLNQAINYEEDTNYNFPNIYITSPPYIPNVTATLTLANPSAGSLTTTTSGSTTSTYNRLTGVWRASGLINDVNHLLAAMQFIPTPNSNDDTQINVVIDNGVHSINGVINMNGVAVNDAPMNLIPGAQTTLENTGITFSSNNNNAIGISDIDAGNNPVRVTLSATHGNLTLGSLTGLNFINGDGSSDMTMTFTGKIADINYALQGLRFTPSHNYSGLASIQIQTNDQGYSGNGGQLIANDVINITVNHVNKAPSIVENKLAISEGQTVILTSNNLKATDPDNNDGELEFKISNVQHGRFELVNNPTVAITSFKQQQIYNREIQFTQDSSEYAPNYQVTVSDGMLTTEPSSPAIAFTNINNSPYVTTPISSTTVENTEIIFSSNNHNAITINDIDAGNNPIRVTLSASHGSLTLGSVTGLTFISGNGSQDSLMSFTGNIANINTALQGLYFKPTNNYYGYANIQIYANDQGNTGAGGALSTTKTISVSVIPINDAPIIRVNKLSITEGQTVVLTSANLSATDPDHNEGELEFKVSDVQHGRFELVGNPTGAITSFKQQDVLDKKIRFRHDGGELAPNYQVTVSDGILTSQSSSASITFTNVNDAPVIVNPVPDQIVVEEEKFIFSVDPKVCIDQESESLTFGATQENGEKLPPWIKFDSDKRRFTGKSDSVGDNRFTLFCQDSGGLKAQTNFNIKTLPKVRTDYLSKTETIVSIVGGTIGGMAVVFGCLYGLYKYLRNYNQNNAADNKNVEMQESRTTPSFN